MTSSSQQHPHKQQVASPSADAAPRAATPWPSLPNFSQAQPQSQPQAPAPAPATAPAQYAPPMQQPMAQQAPQPAFPTHAPVAYAPPAAAPLANGMPIMQVPTFAHGMPAAGYAHPQQSTAHAYGVPQPAMSASAPSVAAPAPAAASVNGYRRRVRWENILPLMTLIALVVAAVMFGMNWKSILGREGATTARTSGVAAAAGNSTRSAIGGGAGTLPTAELTDAQVADMITEARAYIRQGRYDEADLIVNPLTNQSLHASEIAALRAKLTALEAREAKLLNTLGRQQARSQWKGMLVTLKQLESMHPLLPSQIKLRELATSKNGAAASAAKRTTSSSTTTRRPTTTTGSRTHASAQHTPAPGVNTTSGSATKPPTKPAPISAPPTVPSAPNTGGGGIGDVMGPMPGM